MSDDQLPARPNRRSFQARSLNATKAKKLVVDGAALVRSSFLPGAQQFPLVLQPNAQDLDLPAWVEDHHDFLDQALLRHGAVLARGFNTDTILRFEAVALAVCSNLYSEYGDLPPEKEGKSVYQSTPYPPDRPILFHNESSHMPSWPSRQFFYCVRAAAKGGETPLVDCREVYRRLPPELAETFAAKGLLYLRNFKEGLDVHWHDFFKTTDPAVVEAICKRDGMTAEWLPDRSLRIRRRAPAVIRHPRTGELSFFNQIQLHHIGYLDEGVRAYIRERYLEEEYPRNVFFGDGTPISRQVIDVIDEIYSSQAVAFPWQDGDILLVENMLVAHGRNIFEGERKICVAMGDMIQAESVFR